MGRWDDGIGQITRDETRHANVAVIGSEVKNFPKGTSVFMCIVFKYGQSLISRCSPCLPISPLSPIVSKESYVFCLRSDDPATPILAFPIQKWI